LYRFTASGFNIREFCAFSLQSEMKFKDPHFTLQAKLLFRSNTDLLIQVANDLSRIMSRV